MSDPVISVIMATRGGGTEVMKCIDSLTQQTLGTEAEILVADCSTDGTDLVIATEYPAVRLLHFAEPLSTQELLRRALRQASGNIIAVTYPHCVFPSTWLESLRRAHESEFEVIGGAVEHGGPDNLISWACYFADYGPFMLPASRRVTSLLAGDHVSYKRSLIHESLDSLQDGYWKVFFHWDIERRGIQFLFDPELVVFAVPSDTFWGFTRRYFSKALRFAAMRCRRISPAARLLHAITAPFLPPLLLYRRIDAVWRKQKHRTKLLVSIPLLVVFVTAWSAGEVAGYLLGPSWQR